MTVTKKIEGTTLTAAVEGRIDTTTAPAFEKELTLEGVKDLVVDLAGTDYISSAGLRVFVRLRKALSGRVAIANANATVREVFEVVGFADSFEFV